MNELWLIIQMAIAGIGGGVGYFWGGYDGLLYVLLALIALDYIMGVMRAIVDKKLSSEIGFRGIFKKILILCLVGIANILDVYIIGNGNALRTAAIFFYISNEGVSLLEHAAHLGLPIPESIKKVLEQLHNKNNKKEN